MKYLLLITALFFIGCTEHEDKDTDGIKVTIKSDILDKDKDRVSEFILTCAKNANPMSDEEGEDLVYQCQKTAFNIWAEDRYVVCLGKYCFNYKWCDDVTLNNEITACKENGWAKKMKSATESQDR